MKSLSAGVVFLLVMAGSVPVFAESAGAEGPFTEGVSIEQVKQGLDTVWVLLAAFMVFFMQAGFGMVEAGFIRAKS